MDDDSGNEYMWHVCQYYDQFRSVVAIAAAGFGISALWWPFLDPGSGTRIVVGVNLAGSAVFGAFALAFVWKCRDRVEE